MDAGRDQTAEGRGWIEVLPGGLLVSLRGKTGWREVEIGRGPSAATCPVEALELGLKLSHISQGPRFRRITGQGRGPGLMRMIDHEVAQLIKRASQTVGLRGAMSRRARPCQRRRDRFRVNLTKAAGPRTSALTRSLAWYAFTAVNAQTGAAVHIVAHSTWGTIYGKSLDLAW